MAQVESSPCHDHRFLKYLLQFIHKDKEEPRRRPLLNLIVIKYINHLYIHTAGRNDDLALTLINGIFFLRKRRGGCALCCV